MTVPPPSDGRAVATSLAIDPISTLPADLHLAAPTNAHFTASRDPSANRGRALSAASPRNASPRNITPATQSRAKHSIEVERKTSQTYGHHRQTSILGGVHHSRNPSLLASTNTSPLSPQKAGPPGALDHGNSAGLRKSPSLSTLHNNTLNGTSAPANRSFEHSNGHNRPERMHSGRLKRSQEHQRSLSRTQPQLRQESKTVGECALGHLLTSFMQVADEQIERCMQKPGQLEPRVENVCGPGADPAFDQLMWSLGHINRHKPKSLIDSVIHWRKKKADIANTVANELQAMRESRNITQRAVVNGAFTTPTSPPGGQDVLLMEQNYQIAERRSGVSIYILCRLLIEIMGQTTLKALNGPDNIYDTAARLEDVIYGQLQNADPEWLAGAPLRNANWIIRGKLLGVMSGLRFEDVADKFIRDLEISQKKLSVKGVADQKLAAKTAMLVYSMRWLKVKSYPETAWDHSCDMLQLLAKFFAEVHGRTMKYAYSELFEQLLLPVAATATSELNMPKWRDVLAIIQPKITQMLSKADHWPFVFPLQAVLLCVSPADHFVNAWVQLVSSFQPKSKDRSGRSHALKAICRLVWRYLYRHAESQNQIAKKLEEVVKLVFQGGKRFLISTDPTIADPLIQLIRIIGYKHQDLCFRTIIFPLMNSELFSGHDHQLKIENLDPEKTVIGIRAFLAVMTDLEKAEPPAFPLSFECDALMDPSSRSPITHRRTKSQGFAVSAGRTERLSRPVMTTHLNDVTKEYYTKFCKILGQLTIICDNTFGGQAVLDEKFATHTPKTPMAEAFTFNKRDDLMNPTDLRQNYYDLLHVAVEALPRCLSPHLPINSLVNLLCTGTAHVQPHIASSSAQSLKSIARQSHAQQVTIGFARFIFNFDDRYATVSDGSLLGPGHIESTLKLYVELLQIWIDDIQRRTRRAAAEPSEDGEQTTRPLPLDLHGVQAHVEEVEAHGLFFLCSPSRTVRAIAVTVLRLVTKFDTALGQPCTRIISILEEGSGKVININDERLSIAERSRLQKGLRRSNSNSTLVELCSSDIAHDANLWFKIFPNVVRLSAEVCTAVALTLELVCQRLSHSYRTINMLAGVDRQGPMSAYEPFPPARPGGRFNSSSPDTIIEQWKIHLVFACTTLTNIGGSAPHPPKSSQSSHHTRKSSKSSSTSQEKIASATELFAKVVPFLSVPNAAVRDAAVTGLGATNVSVFQALLQCLQPYVQSSNRDAKERLAMHHRTMSSPRRPRSTDDMRLEITRLLSLTCHLLGDQAKPIEEDDYAFTYLMDYAKHLRIFLSDTDVQSDWDFQKLRTYFCSLIEGLYDCTRKLKDPSRWMSFQSRQATFALMENWCGLSLHESGLRRPEDHHHHRLLSDQEQDHKIPPFINSTFEKDKNELQNAALSAMATLSAGPLNFVADNKILMQFDTRRLQAWITSIFETPSDRTHAIGRKALQNLIVHNPDQQGLMGWAMKMCYTAKAKPSKESKESKVVSSYFEVVTRVLIDNKDSTVPFWKILCVGLYTLGNEDSQIRTKSARLLRTLEERQGKTSKLQDLDISVSDKTTAVYKLAQFEISSRLAKQHAGLAFYVFSEFSNYFRNLQPDHQRNMVSAMLPWIQTINLTLEPTGEPNAASYMLLVNLFEITVKSTVALHNEIQALWQALATGPYSGNVQLVLDFIITMCLEKKEQNFVIYAKQIVVFLSKTPAGARVVEYLLLKIRPDTMVRDRRKPMQAPSDVAGFSHVADISTVLPSGAKQSGLFLGQLAMILLVDLAVSPFSLSAESVPTLLQVIMVQWDHDVSIVQDHAREMLVHLIHELVISKIDPGSTEPDKQSIEDFIDSVRRQDPKISWSKAEEDARMEDDDSQTVSATMAYVVGEVLEVFSVTYPAIQEEWAKVTATWATSCPHPHVACRSFQVFRCITTSLDDQVLCKMLGRLSGVIADDAGGHEYLSFSLETLTTLRSIIEGLTPEDLIQYPQLFWATCACLDTIFEREFQEGLRMLSVLLDKLDLANADVLDVLSASQPPQWAGVFKGVHELIYKGMRSSLSMERCLAIMERLMKVPSNEIVGGDERLLFTVLANLPRFLHHFEEDMAETLTFDVAETLASAAGRQGHGNLARALQGLAKSKYRSQKDFLSQCLTAIRTAHFPTYEFDSLVFLLGMVNNECDWFKLKTMQVLCVMMPDIDMRKPEIASNGPDLISPLLRVLQTDHCQQALDVLDNIIELSGTPLDNKHLRMSIAGSHSSRATRKEYESTKSLYGIPEASGWSVPMPAKHAAITRNNVRAVCDTLNFAGPNGLTETVPTPEIEFHRDDYQDSYFGERTMTMTTDDTKVDGHMSELAMKLDSLDDFFEEPGDATSPDDANGLPRYPSGLIEERENLYAEQVEPILRRSLHRTASVTSFQTSFAEARYQPPREPVVMNPAAFVQNASVVARPGLHNRSVTSPAVPGKKVPDLTDDLMSGDEAGDEPDSFSDDELSIGRAHTADEPHQLHSTIKPAGFKAGLRQGLRRLTSTSVNREAREAVKAAQNAQARSPKVPKLPATYLKDPMSSEL